MRNVQVIDGAANCTYSVFTIADHEFARLFPDDQDVAFVDEVIERLGADVAQRILGKMWARPILKRSVRGIHGTLFFGLDAKKSLYPTRQEQGVDPSAINVAQRALFKGLRRRSARPRRGEGLRRP